MKLKVDAFDDSRTIPFIEILCCSYQKERISLKDKVEYEKFIQKVYLDEFDKFLLYRERVEAKTPNLKEMYYDWLDGNF